MRKESQTKPISERVKELRVANAWTQEDLAAKSGISVPTIQRVEGGKAMSADTRAALASAFNVPAKQIAGELLESRPDSAERDYLPLTVLDAGDLLKWLAEANVLELDYDELPNEKVAETLENFYKFCKGRVGAPVPDSPMEHFQAQAEAKQQIGALHAKRLRVAGNTYTRTCYEVADDEDGSMPMVMAKWDETCLHLRFGFDRILADRAYIDYSRQPKYSSINDPKIVRAPNSAPTQTADDEIPF
jgi:transcriptional regulator with XRE-family HTH domain